MNQILVGWMVKVNIHTYGYFYVHEYRPHVSLLTWTYVGICAIMDTVMCSFQNLCMILSFECTLFDQPYRNPHSAQNDTQMECVWVSHETKRIDGPFCHL